MAKVYMVTYDHLHFEDVWGIGCTLLGIYPTVREATEAIDSKVESIWNKYSPKGELDRMEIRDTFEINCIEIGKEANIMLAEYEE